MQSIAKTGKIMVVVTAMLACAVAVRAQGTENDGCKVSTLRGDYALRISGEVFSPSGRVIVQRDGIVMQHYDGAGGLKQEDYVLANGVLEPGPTDPTTGFHTDESGTYTVNDNCTGTATINFAAPGPDLDGAVIEVRFVLSNHGRTIHQIVSSLKPPAPKGEQVAVPANIHADGEKLGSVRANNEDS
ncbi:MAG TPA: hypothetical protein VEJ67_10310 [Candidatus Cybelea sp.]|nr:hypothetical protein [Candidatus Cybelea sp.]